MAPLFLSVNVRNKNTLAVIDVNLPNMSDTFPAPKAPDSAPEQIEGTEKGNLGPMRSKWTGKFDVWTRHVPEDKREERPREGRSL